MLTTPSATWVAVVLLGLGVVAVVRSALIVAANGSGSFRGDLLLSVLGGFGLIYLGQYLIDI